MTTPEQNQNPEEQKPDEGAAPAQGIPSAEEGKVELTGEQYNAILDSLDELQDLKTQLAQKTVNPPTVDSLADEGKVKPTETAKQVDVNQLEGEALVSYLTQQIETNVAQPLLVKIEEMRINMEIKELTADGKNADFWDYKDDIYNIAARNPNLSIAEAYNLAKTSRGVVKETQGSDKTKNIITNLPNRREVPIAEKGGVPSNSLNERVPETRQDAASDAWDELEKEGKI